MIHLVLLLYVLCLMSGLAAFVVTLLVYLRYRQTAFLLYMGFLALCAALVFVFAFEFYRCNIVGPRNDLPILPTYTVNVFYFMVFGILSYAAPRLFHHLGGIPWPSWKRILHLAIATFPLPVLVTILFLRMAGIDALPILLRIEFGFYVYAFFAVLAAALVQGAFRLRVIERPIQRAALLSAIILTVICFPGFIVDVNWQYFQEDSRRLVQPGFTFLPIYFLAWNILSIIFAARAFFAIQSEENHLWAEASRLEVPEASYSRYGLTDQEKKILLMVIHGESNQDIAEKLFISLGTAKNHIHHIYTKTGARSRLELARLIVGNSK